MNISNSINNEFKTPSLNEWKDLVASQLKTEDIDKKIIFSSVEGIKINALNTKSQFNYSIKTFPESFELMAYKKENFKDSFDKVASDLDIENNYDGVSDISSSFLHNAGSSIVDELTYILESFEKESIKGHVQIEVSLDSQIYLNISKLRALRFMLDSFIKSNSLQTTYSIIATTSLREQTFFDPWMNMLRAVSSLSSAIMGGANAFAITSYDFAFCLANNQTPNELALRNAINMGKILLEESKLSLVKDSMHGSYAVENITHEIVMTTSKLLKQNFNDSTTLDLPFYKNRAQLNFEKRLNLINKRKYIMSGINDFVNLDEDIVDIYKSDDISIDIPAINGFAVNRLAYSFEKLRLEVSLSQAKIQLVNIGELKSITARSSFCKNYFEVAGIKVDSIYLKNEDLNSYQFDGAFCICTTDENLESVLREIRSSEKLKFIAGKSIKSEGYTNIFMGQNIFEVLSSFQGEV